LKASLPTRCERWRPEKVCTGGKRFASWTSISASCSSTSLSPIIHRRPQCSRERYDAAGRSPMPGSRRPSRRRAIPPNPTSLPQSRRVRQAQASRCATASFDDGRATGRSVGSRRSSSARLPCDGARVCDRTAAEGQLFCARLPVPVSYWFSCCRPAAACREGLLVGREIGWRRPHPRPNKPPGQPLM
jgi:hypothetical protein